MNIVPNTGLKVNGLYSWVPNKRVGWGKKSKNANRVDSFTWHPRLMQF